MGGSSVVRCPPSRSGRAAVARRRLRPRRCQSSATLLSGNRSRCRAPVSRLRTPPSLRFPFALGRAPRYTPPSGSTLAPSPPNSLRSLRQQYSGVRGRFFCSGRAGSSYLAACPTFAGYRSRSACRDPPCGRHEAGRARPLHVAWRSRFGRVWLGLLACLRAPNNITPTGSQLAPSPPNSLRSLRQQYSGVRGRFFCSGRAGSSYLAACPTFAGYRSRSACRDPPCGRHEAGRARPLHVAWRSRFGRVRLGLLVNGGSSAPVPPRLATLGATALCVPRRARLRPRRYRLRNAPSPCCV